MPNFNTFNPFNIFTKVAQEQAQTRNKASTLTLGKKTQPYGVRNHERLSELSPEFAELWSIAAACNPSGFRTYATRDSQGNRLTTRKQPRKLRNQFSRLLSKERH